MICYTAVPICWHSVRTNWYPCAIHQFGPIYLPYGILDAKRIYS